MIERPLQQGEEPFGKWFVSSGICVANTGKYGYDSTENEIRMTVLRGAVYADHYGDRDDRCPYIDQGLHRFTYQIFPYKTAVDAHRRAALLNMPVRCVTETFHHGPLGESYEGCVNRSEDMVITAIKMAEDNEGAVIRGLETGGKETKLDLNLFGKDISIAASPYSVKTVNEAGNELNFMEWERTQ